MPVLENLKNLIESERIEPLAPSWSIVNYFLLKNAGDYKVPLGAVVAASAECVIFNYARKSIEPMYFNTIGGFDRLKIISGFSMENLRTSNAEEAFQFIRQGIDEEKGIFVSGPEIAICYGYEDAVNKENRKVYGLSGWGPGLNGTLPWESFKQFVKQFGNNEGFAFVSDHNDPAEKTEVLKMLTGQVIDWQQKHPAVKLGQNQEFYGLEAFRNFIRDLSDPDMRGDIDQAYINCHIIEFQSDGRYWLGKFIMELANKFSGELNTHLATAGNHYLNSFKKLRQFYEYDILDDKTESETTSAIGWLKDAYSLEEKILEEFIAIRNILQTV